MAGNGLTTIALVETVPLPQELFPFTVIFPDTAEVPKLTTMESMLLVPFAPVGKVHV